mgnify:CR=1 FL=1
MHVHASPGGSEKTSRILRFSLVVTAAYIVLLVVAGIRAHSLALLSEAMGNAATLLSVIAVAAAPFTAGESLALLIPAGIIFAVLLGLVIVKHTFLLTGRGVRYARARRRSRPSRPAGPPPPAGEPPPVHRTRTRTGPRAPG